MTRWGIAFCLFFAAFSARAQSAAILYDQAVQLYASRNQAIYVDQAIEKLQLAYQSSADAKLAYKIKVLSSRLYIWKSLTLDKGSLRQKALQQAIRDADKAKEIGLIDLNQEFAEAYFYHGWALYMWSDAEGENEILARRRDILLDLGTSIYLTDMDQREGAAVEYYGPYRVSAMLLERLPDLFDGSRKRAIEDMGRAFKKGNDLVENHLAYAQVLMNGTLKERRKACTILNQLTARSIHDFAKDRLFENEISMKKARQTFELACLQEPL